MNIKVKICGITNYEDALCAIEHGVDYLGFIFAKSPRQVTPEQVKCIIKRLKDKVTKNKVKFVGVFVNEDNIKINAIIKKTGIDIIQYHGDESTNQTNACQLPWYRAIRVNSKEDVDLAMNKKWFCNRLLADTKTEGVYGGSGKIITPEIALYAKNKIQKSGKEFFLAGGITPDNVYSIIEAVKPDGIDLGSGVEIEKGKKSADKIKKLFREIIRFEGS